MKGRNANLSSIRKLELIYLFIFIHNTVVHFHVCSALSRRKFVFLSVRISNKVLLVRVVTDGLGSSRAATLKSGYTNMLNLLVRLFSLSP